MNNVPANIRVVDQVPVINRDIVDVQGVSRTSYAVKFVDAGVSVQVTPMIGEDGMITVDVKPQVTEQTGTVVTPDGLIEEPILSTRETSTIVRVADGQAIALGGLRSTRKDETRQGIPFLMDVPMLGQLFSSTVQSRTEVELMILLVPRILDSSWIDEEIRRGEHRLVNLRRPFQWNSIQLDSHRPEDWGAGALQIAPFAAAEPSARVPDAEPPPAAAGKNLSVTRDGLAGRLLVRAQKAIDEGQHRQAIVWLEEALALAPRRVDALVAAGVLSSRTGNRGRAHLWLERAVELAPDDPVALTALGALELLDASPRAAKGHLERAHAAIGTSTSASNLAAAMLLSGETEAARTLLRAAGDAQSPPELHANLAYAELATGNLTAARAAFERALAAGAEPRNPRVNALQRMLQPVPAAGK
jgi:Flp pilus assembly protein TadD